MRLPAKARRTAATSISRRSPTSKVIPTSPVCSAIRPRVKPGTRTGTWTISRRWAIRRPICKIGDTALNLKSAVHGETHEYTNMYPGMAKTAREEGFGEIADWFETLAKAEKSHAGRFDKALSTIS